MAILANRVKTGSIFADFIEAIKSFLFRSFAILLILVSVFLLYSPDDSRIKIVIFQTASYIINPISLTYNAIANNILEAKQYAEDVLKAKSENISLRLENIKLQKLLEKAAIIKSENIKLQKHLKLTSLKANNIILTSRLISNISGLYSNGGIIQAGLKDNLRLNQIIVSNGNIVGKISHISDHFSQITFVTDTKSRIPVITSLSHEKAIMTGDGQRGGRLLYLPEKHKIKTGEYIMSSGDGKYYPYGLPIAKVIKVDNSNIYVEPVSDIRRLQFISVLGMVE